MGDTGKSDKGKKEQRKKPKLTIKEKRKLRVRKRAPFPVRNTNQHGSLRIRFSEILT